MRLTEFASKVYPVHLTVVTHSFICPTPDPAAAPEALKTWKNPGPTGWMGSSPSLAILLALRLPSLGFPTFTMRAGQDGV